MGCLDRFSPSTISHCHQQEICKFESSLKASPSSSSSPSSSTELISRRRASCWYLGQKQRNLAVSCGRVNHGDSVSSSNFVREKNGYGSSSSRWRQHEVRMRMRTAIGFEEASGLQEDEKTNEEPMITEVKLNMPEKTGCLFQAFGWNSHLRQDGKTFYERMTELAPELKATGFTHILFPPCTRATDPQGNYSNNTLYLFILIIKKVSWKCNLPSCCGLGRIEVGFRQVDATLMQSFQ